MRIIIENAQRRQFGIELALSVSKTSALKREHVEKCRLFSTTKKVQNFQIKKDTTTWSKLLAVLQQVYSSK